MLTSLAILVAFWILVYVLVDDLIEGQFRRWK
jgi:hypothetical protein